MTRISRELEQLANACGVMTAYEDVFQRRQVASVDSLLAVLGALGVDVASLDDVPRALEAQRLARLEHGIEPVIVGWDGEPVEFEWTLPRQDASGKAACTVEREDHRGEIRQYFDLSQMDPLVSSCGRFVTFRVRLALGLDFGYHRLTIENAGRTYESLILAAPRRAYATDTAKSEDWGCFLPLYALRSQRNWGAGDFTDLQDFVSWTARLGGTVVGTLPLLAAFLDEPCEPSPYAPASRLAWNEFYVDVTSVPELADCAEAARLVDSSAFRSEVTKLRESDQVDYRRIMAVKRQVLDMLSNAFFRQKPQQRYGEFEQFLKQHPYVEDYAEFRAAHERRREPWTSWPLPQRDGCLSHEDYDRSSKQYHLYAQWIATSQLESLADAAGGGLYLDLPLGVRPDGYDVYRWRNVYACNASAGSPPDAMWTKGQDWCFPPLHPQKIREQGYQHVRDYLAHHLRLARLLRIDHVMQLHRLYWIPHGMRADQGAYVRYRPDEFYAILNIESHRRRTAVIGENLGTVPPEVNEAMEQHGLQRMYVVQYEVASTDHDFGTGTPHTDPARDPRSRGRVKPADTQSVTPVLSEVPPGSLASLNTHDMPSFAAWWRGTEISLRQQLGLLSNEAASRESDALIKTRANLSTWLRSEGWLDGSEGGDTQVLFAILKFLAASEASAVLVNLEDLWLETRPQNIPGTGPELPNWKRKAVVAFDKFAGSPDVLTVLQEVARLRKQACSRATATAQQTT